MKDFLTSPVIWFFIGLVLLLLELALPGLIVIFFGIGAWITALAIILFHPDINVQIIIFLISSILSLALLRRYLKKKFFHEDKSEVITLEDEFIGKIGIADTDMKAGKKGRIQFKGSTWSAISDVDIESGSQVKVVNKESITLIVTKLN
jgi:membrane protein implicated in regulation of membrane protease activity